MGSRWISSQEILTCPIVIIIPFYAAESYIVHMYDATQKW